MSVELPTRAFFRWPSCRRTTWRARWRASRRPSRGGRARCGSRIGRWAVSRRAISTGTRSGGAWPAPPFLRCCTWAAAGRHCLGRSTTTVGLCRPTTWVAERTCGPRTSRRSTTRPRRSSPAWCSTASSTGRRICRAGGMPVYILLKASTGSLSLRWSKRSCARQRRSGRLGLSY